MLFVKRSVSFAPDGLNEIENETFWLLHPKLLLMKKMLYGFGLLFSMMTAIGFFLKVLHWSLANELLITGMGGILLVVIPMIVVNMIRYKTHSSLERAKDRLGIASAILWSAGGILKVLHVVAANETLLLGTVVFALGFLPCLFLIMYRKSVESSQPQHLQQS
jgi:hypothetical protein